jgi:hypothetical protein
MGRFVDMVDAVLADAGTLLEQRWGTRPELTICERLRPNVWRTEVAAAPSDLPRSVIVRVGPERLEGELPAGIGWASVFANEWAGQVFLNRLGDHVAGRVPDLLAHDLDARILVTEDLGAGPSLETLLNGSDATAASDALVDHARLLGTIAASTRDRVDEYRELRARAAPSSPASMLDSLRSDELRSVLPRLEDELRLAVPLGLEDELVALDREANEAGRWLAYTPADACPDNNVVTGGVLRIFDFGFGGVRHLALDAAYSVIPFPTCWCYGRLPAEVSTRMLAAFRDEVVGILPEAADDRTWEQKLAWATGMWFTGFIASVAARELDREQQRGPFTGRQAAVAQLAVVAARTRGHYPAISDLAGRLGDRLGARWQVDDDCTYAAFTSTPQAP